MKKKDVFEQLTFAGIRSTNKQKILSLCREMTVLHSAWQKEGRIQIAWFTSGKSY